MKNIDMVVEICGSAGEGTISAGEILSRHMCTRGYDVMSFDAYPAEIRGFGKCVAHSRISNNKVMTHGKLVDVLIALNDVHAITQLPFMKERGIIIYDSKPPKYHDEDKSIAGWIEPGMISYGIPLTQLAVEATGNSKGRNMVALGAFSALFGIDRDSFTELIGKRYAKLSSKLIDQNKSSFVSGYNWAQNNINKIDKCSFTGIETEYKGEQLIINGNQAVAQAALKSDLHLYAGYPITPATKIMEIISRELPKTGGVFIQTEDEISAIGNVIGAGFAGKRAMTATSGPGFCLMSEFTGLSVMAEVPAVIVNCQRGGPSTGIPTKTEQSDLNIALFGGSGDSPRVVLAPSTVEECYTSTVLALYIAEKYQTLVVLLLDFFLSNSTKNIDIPDINEEKYRNANIAPPPDELDNYERYKVTENGISPRTIPGTPNGMFTSTGLEHNEKGKPLYDSETHLRMTKKRHDKHKAVLAELPEPEITGVEGEVNIGVISWGSSAGAARDAVRIAVNEGIKASSFSSVSISPFPENEIKNFIKRCNKILIPELNYTGQFAGYISQYLDSGYERLNQVTGLPMAAEDILAKIKEMV